MVKDFALETLLIAIKCKRFNFIVEILVEKKVSKCLYGRDKLWKAEFGVSAPLVHRLDIVQSSVFRRHEPKIRLCASFYLVLS